MPYVVCHTWFLNWVSWQTQLFLFKKTFRQILGYHLKSKRCVLNFSGPPKIPFKKNTFFSSTKPMDSGGQKFGYKNCWFRNPAISPVGIYENLPNKKRRILHVNWCKTQISESSTAIFHHIVFPPQTVFPLNCNTKALFFQPLQHRRDQSPNEAPQLKSPLTTVCLDEPMLACQSS